MKLVLFPIFFASLTFGFTDFDYLDNFTCSVSGYTSKNFELQRQGEDLQVRASDISQKFHWVLQATDCDIEKHFSLLGVFSCESSLTLHWVVTVNFYNLNPGITDAFNETCSMNGELIKE